MVGNMTKVVQNAIASTLDAYFEVLASPMTAQRIENIQIKLMKMSFHFFLLWQLMRKACGVEKVSLPSSWKLHAACCGILPFLKEFGTVQGRHNCVGVPSSTVYCCCVAADFEETSHYACRNVEAHYSDESLSHG
jgi:hypothetical protein